MLTAVPDHITYVRDPVLANVLADDDSSPMANAARILAREVKFWRSKPLYTAPQLPADSIDYKALVLQIAEIAHGSPVDIGLLPVTVRSMQQICAPKPEHAPAEKK